MSALRQSIIRALHIKDPTPGAVFLQAAANGDSDAFQALVVRHGSMVLRVCRQVLGDVHAAEDAFQAVFLLLSKQASRLKRPERLAAWLFGAARRISLNARTSTLRRRRREKRLAQSKTSDVLDELTGRELLAALDQEIERLPETYRVPLLLSFWQGLTQDEIANRLGWSPGSVKGRLERGRNLLAIRLTKRGLTLTVLLALSAQRATLAAELVARTAALAIPGATIPASLLALSACSTSKAISVTIAGTLVIGVGTIGLAGGWTGSGNPKENAIVAPGLKSQVVASLHSADSPQERIHQKPAHIPSGAINMSKRTAFTALALAAVISSAVADDTKQTVAVAHILITRLAPEGEGPPKGPYIEDYVSTHRVLIRSPEIAKRAARSKRLQDICSMSGDDGSAIRRVLKVERSTTGIKDSLMITASDVTPEVGVAVIEAVMESYQDFLQQTYKLPDAGQHYRGGYAVAVFAKPAPVKK
jgi:RNA polymerase sigma factor (sigma-70 family)